MSELTHAQKLIGAYLEGCGVKDSESHARLLLESLMDLGFVVLHRYHPLRGEGDPLETHCNICGATKGEPCRPITSKASLNREFHMERETAFMHKERTR